eukprot:261035-Rhodomonas_salina.1
MMLHSRATEQAYAATSPPHLALQKDAPALWYYHSPPYAMSGTELHPRYRAEGRYAMSSTKLAYGATHARGTELAYGATHAR